MASIISHHLPYFRPFMQGVIDAAAQITAFTAVYVTMATFFHII